MAKTVPKHSERRTWLSPVISNAHGATIALAICFVLGGLLAGSWNLGTTVALITTIAGFEIQLPLIRLFRRKGLPNKRMWLWLAIYGIVALTGSIWLLRESFVLIRLYVIITIVFGFNFWQSAIGRQKGWANEMVVFAGLCLALPFAYTATTGAMIHNLIGLWLLATLFFSSAVFTVPIRLVGTKAIPAAALYHTFATITSAFLVNMDFLDSGVSLLILLPLAKLLAIIVFLESYRKMKITHIGFVETAIGIIFAVSVLLSNPL